MIFVCTLALIFLLIGIFAPTTSQISMPVFKSDILVLNDACMYPCHIGTFSIGNTHRVFLCETSAYLCTYGSEFTVFVESHNIYGYIIYIMDNGVKLHDAD